MTKPTDVLHWADSPTTLRTEPSEPTKNAGFAVLTKLPAQYFNWLVGTVGDWITFLDPFFLDDSIIPSPSSDCILSGDPDEGLSVKDSGDSYLPVMCAQPVTDNVDMAVTVGYLQGIIGNLVGLYHDYSLAPFQIVTSTKTYMPFSDYTPTIAAQGVVVNGAYLEFDEAGIYHIDVSIRWGGGVASPYARSLIIEVGGAEHTAIMHNEVSAAVSRTQQYSLNFEVVTPASDTVRVGVFQASGSHDYVNGYEVHVHQVAKRWA